MRLYFCGRASYVRATHVGDSSVRAVVIATGVHDVDLRDRLFRRLGERGSVAKGDGQYPAGAVGSREGERSLQEALGAHEIGLETWAERIAPPADSGSGRTGAARGG